MTVYLNMLSPLMEDWINSYIQGCLIITESIASLGCSIFKSLSNWSTQVISHAALAIALYSASAYDLETTPCFFDLHAIKHSPKYTAYLVSDLLISGHPAQSAS